ncbi:MAG TPA: hypothetical protein V6C89_10495 [Drouetiella sp.]|jgi:ABC-type sugar transport system substrate-binding protein
MKRARVLSMLAVLVSASAALSIPAAQAEKVLEGQVCSARVHALTSDIDWYKNLNKAEDEAQKSGKLIFWLHILGKIDGAT